MYTFHSKLCLCVIFQSTYPYIHPYVHPRIHTHLLIVWLIFPVIMYICNTCISIHVCVLCVILIFSRIHIQEAEVLSVRFPKEYDHINLAAKHPKLCTYFIQYPVYLWFSIHKYIHTCMHTCTCIDSLNLFPKICIPAINIYIHDHTCVRRVLFWYFLEFIFKKQRF